MQATKYLSVSQFIDITENALKRFGSAVIIGEISEISLYSHLYFKIKDENASLDCLMFSSIYQSLNFKVQVGQKVIIVGQPSLYKKNGSFKFIVKSMTIAGLGIIMERLRALKQQLLQEGVFNQSKREMPKTIDCVGIITSKEGRVLHDIITTIRQRSSILKIKLYPASVQGSDAAITLRKALYEANEDNSCDVLIIGRGGGSFEDLLPFSDEALVRDIAKSKIITISAVGHEPDVSLSDFAADFRAATPTAAAVMVSAMTDEIIDNRINYALNSMTDNILKHLDYLYIKTQKIEASLKASSPINKIHEKDNTLISLIMRLNNAINNKISSLDALYQNLFSNLYNSITPEKLDSYIHTLHNIKLRQDNIINNLLHDNETKLNETILKLKMLNPLNTLERGYSVTLDSDDKAFDIDKANVGDNIKIMLYKGFIDANILNISKKADKS